MFTHAKMQFTVPVPASYLNGMEMLAAEEVLDSKILKYDERLGGLVVAYEDLDYDTEDCAGIVQDEQPDVLFRFKCHILLYAPKKGQKFKAVVSDIKPGHVTLLTAGVFPVVVRASEFPSNAVMHEDQHGRASLVHKKTGELIVSQEDECLLRCLRVSHQGTALNVEASFKS